MHEHHVGVAPVAGLAAAEPAHGDHGDAGGQRAALSFGLLDRGVERGADGHRGDNRQRLAGLFHAGHSQHVGGCGAEQFAAAQRADCGDRPLRGGVPAYHRGGLTVQRRGGPRHELGVLTHDRHHLGRLQQQVSRVTTGGEQPGHALRDPGVVAEQPQVPRSVSESIADLAEREEPRVWLGRAREPFEHHRQQRALDRRPARHPGGQCLDVPQRTRRVGVPERLEPGPRRLGGEPDRLAGEPGDGFEQRPVEQFLVQPARFAGVLPPARGEFRRRVGARRRPRRNGAAARDLPSHRPAEPAQHLGIIRQGVRPAQLAQLEQVLDPAQEPVGGGHRGRVLPAHVAATGQRGQRGQGGLLAECLVGPAVHQLQQLNRELDVTQSAGTQLELAAGLGGRQGANDPAAHGLDFLDEMLALRRPPDHRGERVDVGAAEGQVTGHRPGLEQGLELPRLGPAFVVGDVAG